MKTKLNDKIYSQESSQKWATEIAQESANTLHSRFEWLKLVVNVAVIEKSDVGFNMSSACCWNQQTDGGVLVSWNNATLNCVVNVYALSF